MPRFTIVPNNETCSPTEIIAPDAGNVLNLVSRLRYRDADVLRDGLYAFSVRLSDGGMWSIFQREPGSAPENIPSFC
jgi:hypothetical protein